MSRAKESFFDRPDTTTGESSAAPDSLVVGIGQRLIGNGEWRKVGAPSPMHRLFMFG